MKRPLTPKNRLRNQPPLSLDDELAKKVVRDGYNKASVAFRADSATQDAFGHTYADHLKWLQPFFAQLPPHSEVLDLGSGCGVPDARLLSSRFQVTGVDISEVQVERAKKLVPGSTFLRADMTEVEFPAEEFQGVVCLYALFHLPLKQQPGMLKKVAGWLTPRGLFLVITGHTAWSGLEENWLVPGARMFWSHAEGDTYAGWLDDAGFEILHRSVVLEKSTGHAMFLTRRR
jgi:2-polyprenyl-3-methyl-5-hydroxy-6-metoxy-1,4-benzoquinol methylase